jgi:hypothetical protein
VSVLRGNKQYKTVNDIVIPAGTRVVYVRHMHHEVEETALALVTLPVGSYEWMMNFDDALSGGLIMEA